MNAPKWLSHNAASLSGRTVAITGATGGLGSAVCRYVLQLSGSLILLTRDPEKTRVFRDRLLEEFPGSLIECLTVELTDMVSVKKMCQVLKEKPVDILILNAGAYYLPRQTCATGFDPVFQINFVSHYYIAKQMLPVLARRKGRLIATGSIAHSGSKTDPEDLDFAERSSPELVYGNSKRYLMFSLAELVKENPDVQLSVAHPGITFTNITSHYPKIRLALIKWPMKITFMSPARAARGIIRGMFEQIPYLHWIGPRYAHIWGEPAVSRLNSCDADERQRIYAAAEAIYAGLTAESASESTAACDQAVLTAGEAERSG